MFVHSLWFQMAGNPFIAAQCCTASGRQLGVNKGTHCTKLFAGLASCCHIAYCTCSPCSDSLWHYKDRRGKKSPPLCRQGGTLGPLRGPGFPGIGIIVINENSHVFAGSIPPLPTLAQGSLRQQGRKWLPGNRLCYSSWPPPAAMA